MSPRSAETLRRVTWQRCAKTNEPALADSITAFVDSNQEEVRNSQLKKGRQSQRPQERDAANEEVPPDTRGLPNLFWRPQPAGFKRRGRAASWDALLLAHVWLTALPPDQSRCRAVGTGEARSVACDERTQLAQARPPRQVKYARNGTSPGEAVLGTAHFFFAYWTWQRHGSYSYNGGWQFEVSAPQHGASWEMCSEFPLAGRCPVSEADRGRVPL